MSSVSHIRHRWWIFVMLGSSLLVAACGGQLAAERTVPPAASGPGVPGPVQSAHEAVLAFLRDGAAECVPQVGVSWEIATGSSATPAGFGVYRYNAGGCDMTIAYAEPVTDDTRYYVALGDATTGYCWQAQVDSRGQLVLHRQRGCHRTSRQSGRALL